jgi:hypothetical protein
MHTAAGRPAGVAVVSFLVSDLEGVVARLRSAGIPFDGPKPLRPG